MIVKAPEPKYPPAPEGTFPAVCVDEIDLGMVENKKFGGTRHMVRLVWQIDEEVDNDTAAKFRTLKAGSRYLITQDYTASLDEKAKLRKHLQSWRGRAFTPVELFSFDLETIVGAPCLLSIVNTHGSRGDMVWANVEAVMKLPKGTEALQVNGYVRVKDRKVSEPPAMVSMPRTHVPEKPAEERAPDWDSGLGVSDDDVPFRRRPQGRGRAVKNMLQMRSAEATCGILPPSCNGRWASWQMQGMHQGRRRPELCCQAPSVLDLRKKRDAGPIAA